VAQRACSSRRAAAIVGFSVSTALSALSAVIGAVTPEIAHAASPGIPDC